MTSALPRPLPALDRYIAELGDRFFAGFDPGAPAPLDVFVVAHQDARVVACGGLRDLEPGVGEVKRMWVDPDCRGVGLGSRLLAHLEELARARGHSLVRLDTHASLLEAVALYDRSHYRRIERYNDNPYAELFFEKSLTAPG